MTVSEAHRHGNGSTAVGLCSSAELTASADVDVQVAFDHSAAFQGLSGVHRVDDLLLALAHFITETITGCAGHAGETGDRQGKNESSSSIYAPLEQRHLLLPARIEPPFSQLFAVFRHSLVCRRPRVPRRTLGHALLPVDDERVRLRQVHFGAELHADAAPALELVGARWALGHAAPSVIVVHAGGAGHVASRERAAAQALGVAALAIRRASSPSTLLWALWRAQKRELDPCKSKQFSLTLCSAIVGNPRPGRVKKLDLKLEFNSKEADCSRCDQHADQLR